MRTKLATLAGVAGFASAPELANYCGLATDVVQNAWHEENWPDNMRGQTVRVLMLVPEISAYLASEPVARLDEAVRSLNEIDVTVSREAIRALRAGGTNAADLSVALEIGRDLLSAQDEKALMACNRRLSAFWTVHRSRAFEATFRTTGPPVINTDQLVAKCVELLAMLSARKSVGGDEVNVRARQVLVHYLSRHGLVEDQTETTSRRGRELDERCRATALMIRDDDMDAAERYAARVSKGGRALSVERYMFPAWTGDIPVTRDVVSITRTPLPAVTSELIREVLSPEYPSAYLWYLARVYLPIAAEVDPALGGQREALRNACVNRLHKDDLTAPTKTALETAVQSLAQ